MLGNTFEGIRVSGQWHTYTEWTTFELTGMTCPRANGRRTAGYWRRTAHAQYAQRTCEYAGSRRRDYLHTKKSSSNALPGVTE